MTERTMTGMCIFCKSTEKLNRRLIGAGIEVDVCENCTYLGQQAMAIVQTLKPFQPIAERFVGGIVQKALAALRKS